jgi:hypothetical protein
MCADLHPGKAGAQFCALSFTNKMPEAKAFMLGRPCVAMNAFVLAFPLCAYEILGLWFFETLRSKTK